MSKEQKEARAESRYKLTPTEYKLLGRTTLDQLIKEVTEAGGGIPDLVWIINGIVSDVIHKYCDAENALEALIWEQWVQRQLLRDSLGLPKEPRPDGSDPGTPQPTTTDIGTA